MFKRFEVSVKADPERFSLTEELKRYARWLLYGLVLAITVGSLFANFELAQRNSDLGARNEGLARDLYKALQKDAGSQPKIESRFLCDPDYMYEPELKATEASFEL